MQQLQTRSNKRTNVISDCVREKSLSVSCLDLSLAAILRTFDSSLESLLRVGNEIVIKLAGSLGQEENRGGATVHVVGH